MSGTQWTFLTYLSLYLPGTRGFSLAEAGLALAIAQGLGSVGRLLWSHLSDAEARRVHILLAMSCLALVSLALLASDTVTAVWPVVAVSRFAIVGWNGAYHGLVAERAGPGRVGEPRARRSSSSSAARSRCHRCSACWPTRPAPGSRSGPPAPRPSLSRESGSEPASGSSPPSWTLRRPPDQEVLSMQIKYIIPFPFDEEGIANRAAQLPAELRTPGVDYDFVPVKNSCRNADGAYELLILDAYIAEAGLRSEEEGYDAVVMDTVSDSGLAALRSRLTIPVLGPGLVQQHVAAMLGKKFSILTMWRRWFSLYEKTMAEYGTRPYCASIRSIDVRPDQEQLLAGKEEVVFAALEEQGRLAIDEDGADVILIGSTTMHQAVEHLRRTLGVPVINPGLLAIKMAELFVQLGLSHSKVAYMSPETIQDEKLHSLMPT